MTNNELLEEAFDNSERFSVTVPFEVYWDFAGIDKEKLRELIELSYVAGYMDGKTNV